MVFDSVLERYQRYLQEERGSSTATARVYQIDIAWLIEKFSLEDPNDIPSLSPKEIQAQLGGFKPSTQMRRMAGLSSFFKFLSRKEDIPCNFDFQRPENGDREEQPPYVSKEAYHKIREIKFSRNGQDARNLALLDILYGTGIRTSTASALNWENVDLKTNSLRGLERYVREIPLSQESQESLTAYHQEILPENQKVPCFRNRGNERLSRRSILKVITKYGEEETGIELSPRTLRWSCLCNLMEEGRNIEDVLELMGYNIKTAGTFYAKAYKLRKLFPRKEAQ